MTQQILAFSALAPQEWGLLAIAFVSVAFGCFLWGRKAKPAPQEVKSAALPATPPASPRAEAEVIAFLALLQEKGRLIDFLMDDVTRYSDTEVGAAARVVHQGCQAVLREHLTVEPIANESEGETVELAPGYNAADYRLLGKVSGEAPFRGTLVHQGWRAGSVNLPRTVSQDDETLPNIAPAQVELS